MSKNKATDGLLGLCVGDAFGVPYEFSNRAEVSKKVQDIMIGYGTWDQPAGTWSDDSSLSFCLAESLGKGKFDLKDIAKEIVLWKTQNKWTANGYIFDIGITTREGINTLIEILESEDYECLNYMKNEANESSNGNGGLMRILPLIFYIKGKDIKTQFDIVWQVSALTHGHLRSALSCMIYLKMVEYILNGDDKKTAYEKTKNEVLTFLTQEKSIPQNEIMLFYRILEHDISQLNINDIKSSGYVIDSLEASIWSFLNTNSYKDSIILSVSLGGDTDTIASITGGIAGIYYGKENIPQIWLDKIFKLNEIIELGERLGNAYK